MSSHSLVLRSAAMGSGGHVTALKESWWVIQIHGRILLVVGLSQVGRTFVGCWWWWKELFGKIIQCLVTHWIPCQTKLRCWFISILGRSGGSLLP